MGFRIISVLCLKVLVAGDQIDAQITRHLEQVHDVPNWLDNVIDTVQGLSEQIESLNLDDLSAQVTQVLSQNGLDGDSLKALATTIQERREQTLSTLNSTLNEWQSAAEESLDNIQVSAIQPVAEALITSAEAAIAVTSHVKEQLTEQKEHVESLMAQIDTMEAQGQEAQEQLANELNTAVDALMGFYQSASETMGLTDDTAFLVQSKGTLVATNDDSLVESRSLRTSSVGVDSDTDVIEEASEHARQAVERVNILLQTADQYVVQVNNTVTDLKSQVASVSEATPEQVDALKAQLLASIQRIRTMISGGYDFSAHSGAARFGCSVLFALVVGYFAV